jgi:hypothetical protein
VYVACLRCLGETTDISRATWYRRMRACPRAHEAIGTRNSSAAPRRLKKDERRETSLQRSARHPAQSRSEVSCANETARAFSSSSRRRLESGVAVRHSEALSRSYARFAALSRACRGCGKHLGITAARGARPRAGSPPGARCRGKFGRLQGVGRSRTQLLLKNPKFKKYSA